MKLEDFTRIYQTQLTPRQRQVLDLFLAGYSNYDIVQQIGVTHPSTALQHIKNVCREFGIVPEQDPDYKDSLVQLFAQYQPTLISSKVLEKYNDSFSLPPFPENPEPLNSRFYVERPPIESRCYRMVEQPGSLIRIKASKQMGKTSLLKRIIAHAKQQKYHTVYLNFRLIERSKFQDESSLLSSFCLYIFNELSLSHLLKKWEDNSLIMQECTYQFQSLLKQLDGVLVLVLDEVDKLFEYPEIFPNFFSMLRAWYEKANESETWEKLRLVVSHATENYGRLDINRSPFNVGLAIKLPEFNLEQVEDLALRHGLNKTIISPLMNLVGGHPYLIRLAFYHLTEDIPFDKLLTEASTNTGIYQQYLLEILEILQKNKELGQTFKEIIEQKTTIKLNHKTVQLYQLESIGLIKLEGDFAKVRYNLYRLYFSDRL